MKKSKLPNRHSKIVAVFFGVEYLSKSAIARFSVETFCHDAKKFHVFTKSPDIINQQDSSKKTCIFNIADYHQMDEQFNYIANIFVLGNSLYNLEAFEAAIELRKNKDRNYLYFHDGHYLSLLFSWLTKYHYSLHDFVRFYYLKTYSDNEIHNLAMIDPVIQLTDCENIIVNSENCLPLITTEAKTSNIRSITAFLPVPNYQSINPHNFGNEDEIIVAHFGIPSHVKQVHILIEAVALLRKTHNIKLLLAGYGVESYVRTLPEEQKTFILLEESPDTDKMLSLMKGVDIAVQLRWPILGEASGVISEMLGLGLKCITTTGFVNTDFKQYVVELPAFVTAPMLATAILDNYKSMRISSEEHEKLLARFSYQSCANLIFNQVTKQSLTSFKEQENTKNINKKLRILYCASHRILRFEEVSLFIKAGFEVIPVKIHWNELTEQEPGADDPEHVFYPKWRETCSIPDDIIEKIQSIDILKYQDLNQKGGKITYYEACLLNKWIDIIYIPNLLPAVPNVLTWFNGLTLFRVYGEGKIMTYDEWATTSKTDLSVLRRYDVRYATMLMLHSLNGPEHASILGSNVFQVGPCVTKSRVHGKWKGKHSTKVCNIALSYIERNPHWTEMYHTFCQEFNDIPLRFLGKNSKDIKAVKKDERIVGIINDDGAFIDMLTDCRCLMDSGTSPFHTHYTPIEAIMMGIPVIFLESSGMAQEILRVIPKEDLLDCGMCENLSQAKEKIEHCLNDITYAEQIACRQQIITDNMFSPEAVLKQIEIFADAAPELVKKARLSSVESINPKKTGAVKNAFYSLYMRNIWIIKKMAKFLIPFLILAARKTYKVLCPEKYQGMVTEYLFSLCFPRTYFNVIELRYFWELHKNITELLHNLQN